MSAKKSESAVPEKVTRDDIEAKLRELRGEVDERVGSLKVSVTVVAVAVAVTAVVTAYWLGRRRSRKRQTVFEIRRL
jgi:ABC-type spermidine/putrescine transport system permease subunit II